MTDTDLLLLTSIVPGDELETIRLQVANEIRILQAGIERMIDSYDWSCDNDCSDYSESAAVLIDQLKRPIK